MSRLLRDRSVVPTPCTCEPLSLIFCRHVQREVHRRKQLRLGVDLYEKTPYRLRALYAKAASATQNGARYMSANIMHISRMRTSIRQKADTSLAPSSARAQHAQSPAPVNFHEGAYSPGYAMNMVRMTGFGNMHAPSE